MGTFDDAMKNAVPGGNLATPIAVAVGALILGKMFGGSSAPAPAPGAGPLLRHADTGECRRRQLLGGLGDLIGKLTAGAPAPQVNSWVGPAQNAADQPGSSAPRSARTRSTNSRSVPGMSSRSS